MKYNPNNIQNNEKNCSYHNAGLCLHPQITKTEDGVKIARMVLSRKPYVADESEALMNLLQGLGTM